MSTHTTKSHFYDDTFDYSKLKEVVEYGIVDLQQIQEEYAMKERQELLDRHPFNI